MLVEDTQNSLKFFDEETKAEEEEEGPTPCEPKYLYMLDENSIPQVSYEAINIINAYISGDINPDNWDEYYYESGIVTKPQLQKLFNRKNAPPGFEDIDIPVGQNKQAEEEEYEVADEGDEFNYDDQFGMTADGFDPVALGLHDGSLQ